ncbi:MAG: hypothetical protein LRY75_01285 [Shewanella xiamenensis]|jgi:hypothetical protein|uniref:Toxin co-regulated pilus biosynthesis protein Q C-terminal domain-containing protein n=1 Tax=Shewanella xiamenensis TaxID=332186 RepID=A0AAE4Q5P5_9GAMM|nr:MULTISPECIES: hypothetical protein [Shewanella]MCD8549885.1 hypothetical protein [Shewanella xiamenensis]MCD8557468.1 hypothetical protein [Shewanella xiamenensis]MCT8858100.1 hypothetical protein [Shewanella xiamenensis]MDH0451010.1 hypothetical protein [Shewanella sp. GD04112]MDV5393138.1 hypothetical protein [Shewanella xiamenensis]
MKLKLLAASVLFGLAGCSMNTGITGKTDIFHADAGASLRSTTEALAAKYNLKSIQWHKDITPTTPPLTLPVNINVSELTAESAFDALYENTPFLTYVLKGKNQLLITPYKLSVPSSEQFVSVKSREAEAAKDLQLSAFTEGRTINPVSTNIGLGEASIAPTQIMTDEEMILARYTEGNSYQAENNQVQSIPTEPIIRQQTESPVNNFKGEAGILRGSDYSISKTEPTVNQQVDKPMQEEIKESKRLNNTVSTSPSETYAATIRRYMRQQGLQVMWEVDNQVAGIFRSNPKQATALNANSVKEFATGVADLVNATNEDGKRTYAYINEGQGYVVFHQFLGGASDVHVFNMKKGLLSQNLSELAGEFGWSFNAESGWLADDDCMISVDYPIVTSNNIVNSVLKATEKCVSVQPRFLETKQEVYIVSASEGLN